MRCPMAAQSEALAKDPYLNKNKNIQDKELSCIFFWDVHKLFLIQTLDNFSTL